MPDGGSRDRECRASLAASPASPLPTTSLPASVGGGDLLNCPRSSVVHNKLPGERHHRASCAGWRDICYHASISGISVQNCVFRSPSATDPLLEQTVHARMQGSRSTLHSALAESSLIRSILNVVTSDIRWRTASDAKQGAHVRTSTRETQRPHARNAFLPTGFHSARHRQVLAAKPVNVRVQNASITSEARAQLWGTDSSEAAVPGASLEVDKDCEKFQAGTLSKYRLETAGRACALSDCKQLKSATGCKFLNSGGACYSGPGQVYCSLNTADPRCLTKESGAVGKALYENRQSCEPVPVKSPFTLNYNCERYVASQKQRYLQRCRDEDCKQSRSTVGCAYVSSAGFCWQNEGQAFCSDASNVDDPRCNPSAETQPKYLEGKLCKYPAEDDPLQFAFHCTQYLITGRARDLLYCRKEDCLQARRRAPWIKDYQACNGLGCGGLQGCKYLSKEGFCYVTEGQKWCAALDTVDRSALLAQQAKGRCLTSPETPPPFLQEKKCMPKEKPDPLVLNFNCQRYLSSRRERHLAACRKEDCAQVARLAVCLFVYMCECFVCVC